jgi:hypothetical protein
LLVRSPRLRDEGAHNNNTPIKPAHEET